MVVLGQLTRAEVDTKFAQLGNFIFDNAVKFLLASLLLVAGLVSQLPQLKMDTSTESFLHDDDETMLAYEEFRDQYGRDELLIVAIKTEDIFASQFLAKLNKLHYELRDNTPYLDDITSLINIRDTKGSEGKLVVEDLLYKLPTTQKEQEQVRTRAMSNPLYTNMLFSSDHTLTTIVIKSNAYTSDGVEEDVMSGFDEINVTITEPHNREPLTDVENSKLVAKVQEIVNQYHANDFKVHVTGSPAVTDRLKRSMMSDTRKFVLLSVSAVAVLLFFLFHRLAGVLMPLLVVVLTLFSTLGGMGLFSLPFTLVTQILPSFLLAVGVGASVHLLVIFFRKLTKLQHVEQPDENTQQEIDSAQLKKQAISYAMGHSGVAITMTSLTTAGGLASFSGSEVAPIGDLGLIAAGGIILSLIFTLLLLPALIALLPLNVKLPDSYQSTRGAAISNWIDTKLISVADFATKRYKTVLFISFVLLLFSLTGAMQTKFSHKPHEWLPETDPVRVATTLVDNELGGASNVEVVIDTELENGVYEPAIMQGLEHYNKQVSEIDYRATNGEVYVGKTLSLVDILKETNRALHENQQQFYSVPETRELIAQELLLFENSGSDDMEDFVDSQFSQVRFTARMPWVDSVLYTDFVEELKAKARENFGNEIEVNVTGMVVLLAQTMHSAMKTMVESYMIAVIVISCMMILLIGNLRLGLISMLPNLAPIVLTLGLMGWLDMPLDLFTMLIGSIAIGLAVDDTIHFMHNFRRYHHATDSVQKAVRKTLLGTGRAMLFTTIVLSLGFFLYMFSQMSSLANFGLITGFTIIMALLSDFFLAPALMALLHKIDHQDDTL